MRQTSNDLDLAIDGAGFSGRPTGRHHHVYPQRLIQTGQRGQSRDRRRRPTHPVITIPSGALKIDIGQDGTVSVLLPGVTQASQVGQIQLVFSTIRPVWWPWAAICFWTVLPRARHSRAPADSLPASAPWVTGILESSNVNLAEEMVNMIIAQRSYEINSKTIQASDEMMQIANNLRR